MSLLARVKNSIMYLISHSPSIFAASRPNNWQFAANVEAFLFIGKDNGVGHTVRFKAKMNNSRDYRPLRGDSLRGIGEQLKRKRGGCIQASTVPK
jgi:hypothetical protein